MDASEPLGKVTSRVLPPEEWEKLQRFEPWATYGLPSPDYHEFVVVEAGDGRILGYWCLHNAVHLEPLYLEPDARQKVAVVKELWKGVLGRLREAGVQSAHAIVGDRDVATNLPLATKLGFQVVPGQPLFLDLSQVKES